MLEQRDRDHARHLAKASDEQVVFRIHKDSACQRCQAPLPGNSLLAIVEGEARCMACAGLAELVILPRGDAALTRRASKQSSRRAVVLRWARARKRYEREATLVEPAALAAAREECAADVQKRNAKNARAAVRRAAEDAAYQQAFAAELRRLYPNCPAHEAEAIVRHACEKYSGRVGRAAAAKKLDPEMIRLAAVAHVRHVHTSYDRLLAGGMDRHAARDIIRADVQVVLQRWEMAAGR